MSGVGGSWVNASQMRHGGETRPDLGSGVGDATTTQALVVGTGPLGRAASCMTGWAPETEHPRPQRHESARSPTWPGHPFGSLSSFALIFYSPSSLHICDLVLREYWKGPCRCLITLSLMKILQRAPPPYRTNRSCVTVKATTTRSSLPFQGCISPLDIHAQTQGPLCSSCRHTLFSHLQACEPSALHQEFLPTPPPQPFSWGTHLSPPNPP